jgi:hypothetical protein
MQVKAQAIHSLRQSFYYANSHAACRLLSHVEPAAAPIHLPYVG